MSPKTSVSSIRSNFGNFKSVRLKDIPTIQRKNRSIVKLLPIMNDFERLLTEDHAPFEALGVDLNDYQEQTKKLKSPKLTILAACRKLIRDHKATAKFRVMIRGTMLYLVDAPAMEHIDQAS